MKSYLLVIVLVFTATFNACDNKNFVPEKRVLNEFKTMFPNAKQVEWEWERGYYVAEFNENALEKEAWFETSGMWVLTVSDYERKTPDLIKNAIAATNYADWRIDDVDFIESKAKNSFYVVEIEKGNVEKDLFFSENGEFIEEKAGNGDYHYFP